jgi:hypothetical protein
VHSGNVPSVPSSSQLKMLNENVSSLMVLGLDVVGSSDQLAASG